MQCIKSRPKTTQIDPKLITEFLHLQTIDDTQTAFAKHHIHISETTAAKWRALASNDPNGLLWHDMHASEPTSTPSCMQRAWICVKGGSPSDQHSEQWSMP